MAPLQPSTTHEALWHNTTQSSSIESQNTFILKTYRASDAKQYSIEVQRHVRLNENSASISSIIRFYGGFEQGQSWSLLFEDPDGGTLEDYFRAVKPPTNGEDIFKFWRGLFYLAHAILRLETFNSNILTSSTCVSLVHKGYVEEGMLTALDGTRSSNQSILLLPP